MATGHSLRGSRIGSGPRGARSRGPEAPRIDYDFHCERGHVTHLAFATDVEPPEIWDCASCGLPAGTDPAAPPPAPHAEPYKTHLAYVKERRSDADGEAILAEALARVAARRTPG